MKPEPVRDERGITAGEFDAGLIDSPRAMLLLDRARCIRQFTPGATSLFSLLPGDVGRPIRDFAQNFVDAAFLSDILLVLEGRNASKKEVQSSEGRWYIRQTQSYLLADGSIDGAAITFSDVDAEVLQEARFYAETIVNSVREPLLVVDAELCVHSVNEPFTTLFQVASADVLGQTLRDLDRGVWEIPQLLALLRQVFENGHPMEEFEIQYESRAFGTRSLILNARTLHRGGGRSDLVLVAIDDVTERRRLRKLLQENEARLHEEERLRQRQLELTNALRVSTVGELAAGLAHELNQPLSSISNLVEACAQHVRGGPIDAPQHLELLSEIAAEAIRAAGIVAHLRSFVDKGEPQLAHVDLGEIVRHVPHLLMRELERTRVSLEIDIPETPLPVDADTIQVEQVVVNLLQNAMDSIREAASPQRRIELAVRAVDGMGEVTVRDTGTGASPQAAERMFEAFFTTKKQGLGMGLALSRSILEAHRGRIWMEIPSDGGPGTVVRFSIPIRNRQGNDVGRDR
ncbi:MAG: PAS domain-containing protein [Candidatus Binatia bacterium]